MEPVNSKVEKMFSLPKEKGSSGGRGSSGGSRVDMNVEEWEVRPGGMLVQKRNSDCNQSSASVPTIRIKVKYGSTYHQICISSQASFGELKKLLAEHTGLHPEEQKLIYKKKERDSKVYLDVARVKDGSKIVLVEDITSRQKRCLEMLKKAKIEKASKSIAQISLEIDKFAEQVTDLETTASRGDKVKDTDIDNLIGKLITELVKLDDIVVEGDLKLQKRTQEKRLQSYVETLDMLKVHNTKQSSGSGKNSSRQQEYSNGKMAVALQKKSKQRNLAGQEPELQQPLRHSEPVVVSTKWETFD